MAPVKKAKDALKNLADQFSALSKSVGKPFRDALEMIEASDGNIIVVSYGKSGAVGQRLVSSLRCAGRKAHFMNPVDAFYGEAAAVTEKDVAIIISSGGEADEIMRVVPWFRKKQAGIIAITPSKGSSLARAADVTIASAMPADSTDSLISYTPGITAMALGDLLAMAILYDQDIEHGRSLAGTSGAGEAMYTIEDLLSTRPGNPTAPWDTMFRDALLELTSKGLGAISIVDDDGKLAGIITDGDVRRLLQKSQGVIARLFLMNVDNVMTKNPKRLPVSCTVTEAIELMEAHAITVLPVVDSDGRPVGMVHLHDLVQLGILHRPPEGKKAAAGAKKKSKKKKTAKKKSGK